MATGLSSRSLSPRILHRLTANPPRPPNWETAYLLRPTVADHQFYRVFLCMFFWRPACTHDPNSSRSRSSKRVRYMFFAARICRWYYLLRSRYSSLTSALSSTVPLRFILISPLLLPLHNILLLLTSSVHQLVSFLSQSSLGRRRYSIHLPTRYNFHGVAMKPPSAIYPESPPSDPR